MRAKRENFQRKCMSMGSGNAMAIGKRERLMVPIVTDGRSCEIGMDIVGCLTPHDKKICVKNGLMQFTRYAIDGWQTHMTFVSFENVTLQVRCCWMIGEEETIVAHREFVLEPYPHRQSYRQMQVTHDLFVESGVNQGVIEHTTLSTVELPMKMVVYMASNSPEVTNGRGVDLSLDIVNKLWLYRSKWNTPEERALWDEVKDGTEQRKTSVWHYYGEMLRETVVPVKFGEDPLMMKDGYEGRDENDDETSETDLMLKRSKMTAMMETLQFSLEAEILLGHPKNICHQSALGCELCIESVKLHYDTLKRRWFNIEFLLFGREEMKQEIQKLGSNSTNVVLPVVGGPVVIEVLKSAALSEKGGSSLLLGNSVLETSKGNLVFQDKVKIKRKMKKKRCDHCKRKYTYASFSDDGKNISSGRKRQRCNTCLSSYEQGQRHMSNEVQREKEECKQDEHSGD